MSTWVVVRNNRSAWTNVSVAALKNSFTQYGVILLLNVFDNGAKASMLFENNSNAERFVDDMTFRTTVPSSSLAFDMVPVWGPIYGKVDTVDFFFIFLNLILYYY